MSEIKVSMNGVRRNLSSDIQKLAAVVKNFIDGEYYEHQELIDATNTVICHSNSLNCIWIDGDDDFKNMEDVSVDLLDDYEG